MHPFYSAQRPAGSGTSHWDQSLAGWPRATSRRPQTAVSSIRVARAESVLKRGCGPLSPAECPAELNRPAPGMTGLDKGRRGAQRRTQHPTTFLQNTNGSTPQPFGDYFEHTFHSRARTNRMQK